MLRQRLLTAVVGVPLVVAAVWLGNPWYILLVSVMALGASWEFYRLAGLREKPLVFFGLLWVLLLVISPLWDGVDVLPLLITAAVVIPFFWETLPFSRHTLAHAAWATVGIIYAGWMLSHLTSLREVEDGREWVLLAILATFAFDTASYFSGKLWGRHRMSPAISPGKTWEGALGGVLGAMLASAALVALFDLPPGPVYGAFIGLGVSVFAQAGDLAESVLKRNAGVKDSGYLLPGHGGILDRIDSIVFSVPAVYYYVTWLVK